ncbi:MAG: hypothetical protein MSJ26_08485 [Oscillospiraceae bacterium]|nr:hypothetical protein [Oscillospiraceae bacterium]
MYDNFGSDAVYKRLKRDVHDFIDSPYSSDEEQEELQSRIEEEYERGNLSSSQYDHLHRLIDDYCG